MDGCLIQIIAYVLVLPISLVLATPVILVAAFFGSKRYWQNVKQYYTRIIAWWGEALGYMG